MNLILSIICVLIAIGVIAFLVYHFRQSIEFEEKLQQLEIYNKQDYEARFYSNRKYFASKRYRKCPRIETKTLTYIFKKSKYN